MRGQSPREENFEAFALENTISSHRTSTSSPRRSTANRANHEDAHASSLTARTLPCWSAWRPSVRGWSLGLVEDVVSETSSEQPATSVHGRAAPLAAVERRGRPLLRSTDHVHDARQLVRAAERARRTDMHALLSELGRSAESRGLARTRASTSKFTGAVSSRFSWISSFLSPRAIHRYLRICQATSRSPITFFGCVTGWP